MHDTSRFGWRNSRVTRVENPVASPAVYTLNRCTVPPVGLTNPAEQVVGPDGIRHELVARIRREIEAGTYDTEERWLAAEELILRRCGAGV